jgi:hypothetical protein
MLANVTDVDLETLAQHFIIAALWSSVDDDGTPLDDSRWSLVRKDRDTLTNLAKDWGRKHAALLLELEGVASETGYGSHPDCGSVSPIYAAAGHDLWLTSQGHGVGFWDRGLGELGDRLSKAARLGEWNLIRVGRKIEIL